MPVRSLIKRQVNQCGMEKGAQTAVTPHSREHARDDIALTLRLKWPWN